MDEDEIAQRQALAASAGLTDELPGDFGGPSHPVRHDPCTAGSGIFICHPPHPAIGESALQLSGALPEIVLSFSVTVAWVWARASRRVGSTGRLQVFHDVSVIAPVVSRAGGGPGSLCPGTPLCRCGEGIER
jgi:hypothetical protein